MMIIERVVNRRGAEIYLLLFLIFTPMLGFSQRVALTCDALKLPMFTANVGADIALAEHITLDIEASFNPMKKYFSEKISLHHLSLSPEVRYWFKRPFYSHYVGANMLCSSYDIVLGDKYRDGMVIALGLGYGCSIMLNDRWSLVPSVGLGLGYVSYLAHPATSDDTPKVSGVKLVPTRLGLAFTYIID